MRVAVTSGRVVSRAIWTLPAAGLMLGAPWIRPLFADPADLHGQSVCVWAPAASTPLFCVSGFTPNNLDAWARITTSDGYQLFSLTQVLGMLLLLFGLFALYGFLARGQSPRWALAALILSVVVIVPALMMLGELGQAEPILATFYQNGINVCPTSLAEPGFLDRWGISPEALCKWSNEAASIQMALTVNVLIGSGAVLTSAVAIWRSGLVSKWVALPFGIAFYLCVSIEPLVTLIGGFLMLVVGSWIALQIRPNSANQRHSALGESVV